MPLLSFLAGGTGLDADEEGLLDAQSREMLELGRKMRALQARTETAGGQTQPPQLSHQPSEWLEFGLELAELDFDAEEEKALDEHSRAAAMLGRVLRRKRGDSINRTRGSSVSCSVSRMAWQGFGLNQFSLGDSVEEEKSLDAHSRIVTRRRGHRKGSQTTGPRHYTESGWLGFGLELAAAELNAEEEQALDPPEPHPLSPTPYPLPTTLLNRLLTFHSLLLTPYYVLRTTYKLISTTYYLVRTLFT